MLRKLTIGLACVSALVASSAAFAQAPAFGTAPEAKAMLEKAVAAVKADKAKAFASFKAGEAGFKDRDLYPFCANSSDGIINAHPTLVGKNLKDLKDSTGKAFGEEMAKTAAEGKISEVSYMFPRPGTDTTPVQKVSFITKVTDQVCGVGYYK